jgi:hypothetical protein
LVSRGGGEKNKSKNGNGSRGRVREKGKRKQEKMEEAFDAMDLGRDSNPTVSPSKSSSSPSSSKSPRPTRSGIRIHAHSTVSKPNVSVDGFTTVTGKKGNKNGKGKVSERDSGVGVGDGGGLDHLVTPSLRVALGLVPEGAVGMEDEAGEGEGEVINKREREQQGVGGRGVVDEDAEDEAGLFSFSYFMNRVSLTLSSFLLLFSCIASQRHPHYGAVLILKI